MDHSVSLNFSQLSQDHIKKLKDAFQMIDVDGDGSINRDDLRSMLESIGKPYSDEVLDKMLSRNGKIVESIGFPEFLSLMSDLSGEFPEETELLECMRNLSGNNDVHISLDELIKTLKEAGFKDPENEFAKIFKNFTSTQKTTSTKIFKGDNFLNSISDT